MATQERQRYRDLTQGRILGAALELAADVGWPGVTMRRIADRVGYSHPALYAYFATKEALLGALLGQGVAQLRASLQAAADAAPSPAAALVAIGEAYWDFAWRQPELYQVMHGLGGVAFSSEAVREEGQRVGEPVAAVIVAFLTARGQELEGIERKTALVWSTAHGIVALTMAGRFTQEEGAALIRQAARDAIVAWSAPPDDAPGETGDSS